MKAWPDRRIIDLFGIDLPIIVGCPGELSTSANRGLRREDPRRSSSCPDPRRSRQLFQSEALALVIGAKIVSHGRYIAFQMAEVAIPRNLFAEILRLIAELRPPPVASTT
jgi:hypothetical protein